MGFIAILHHHLFYTNMFGSLFPTTQPANLSKRCITKNYVTSNTHLVGEEKSKPPESGFCGELWVDPPVVVSSGTFMRISHIKIGKKSWWWLWLGREVPKLYLGLSVSTSHFPAYPSCTFFSWDPLCSSHVSFFTSRPVFGSQVLVSGSWPLLPNPQMHRWGPWWWSLFWTCCCCCCSCCCCCWNKQSLRPRPSSLFLPYSTNKDCGPVVVLTPPLEQPICNPFSLFLLNCTNKDCGPVVVLTPPPSNNPSTNKDCGPLCCSDPPPLQQPTHKKMLNTWPLTRWCWIDDHSQDDVEYMTTHKKMLNTWPLTRRCWIHDHSQDDVE